MSGTAANTSIIRGWGQQYALVYSSSQNNGRWVHLMEHGSTAVFSAQIDDFIHDMEILGDTAYYCGNDGNGIPLVGYFPLADLFSGMLNVERVTYTQSTHFHPQRMEVFSVQDGVHVVLVGDETSSSGEYRMLADISHHYPGNNWFLSYYIAYDQIEFFDDIAVTDNYVVTAAHKHQSDGIYMRMFDRPTTADQSAHYGNIFYSVSSPAIYDDIYYYSCGYNVIHGLPDWPVWVTHTTGDSVAIACMAQDNSTNDYGFTMKSMSVSPSPWTIGNDVFVYLGATLNSAWSMRDIRYSRASDKIFLLQDFDSPATGTVESAVTAINNSAPGTMISYFNNLNAGLHSVDGAVFMPNGHMTSGGLSGSLELTWTTNSTAAGNCFTPLTLTPTTGSCKMIPFAMAIPWPIPTIINTTSSQIIVTDNTITIKCF